MKKNEKTKNKKNIYQTYHQLNELHYSNWIEQKKKKWIKMSEKNFKKKWMKKWKNEKMKKWMKKWMKKGKNKIKNKIKKYYDCTKLTKKDQLKQNQRYKPGKLKKKMKKQNE